MLVLIHNWAPNFVINKHITGQSSGGLVHQGLPLRGHKEGLADLGGNLYQLLRKTCPGLTQYTWPTIVNEFINQMGQSVLRKLLSEASASVWFSILADEATDVSHNEQMSISIRWVNTNYDVHKDTLGLIQLSNTRAGFQPSNTSWLGTHCPWNNAVDRHTMVPRTWVVPEMVFKWESPHTLYVHCLAYSLNLCVQKVTHACDIIRDTMSFVYELTQLIKMSNSLKKEITLNTGEITPNLRMLCPTLWTVRHGSIGSILQNYSILQNAEIKLAHDEYAAKGNGMAIRMENFDMVLNCPIYCSLRQSNCQSICKPRISRFRKLFVGQSYWYPTWNHLELMPSTILSMRKSSVPVKVLHQSLPFHLQRLDDGANPHVYVTPKDRFWHKHFETLELAVGEIERIFNQEDIGLINSLESFLIDNANDNSTSMPDNLETYLKDTGFDLERLKVQVPML